MKATTKGAVLLAASLSAPAIATACSSSRILPPTETNVDPIDAGPPILEPDGAVCTTVPGCGHVGLCGPPVYETSGLGAAPVGTGGSFASGTYNLQSVVVYGEDGGVPADSYWVQETWIVTLNQDAGVPTAATDVPVQLAHGDFTSIQVVSVSGFLTAYPQGEYAIDFNCNSANSGVTTGTYTAGPSAFTLYLGDPLGESQNVSVYTYVKID
jgi:hypothetical protein